MAELLYPDCDYYVSDAALAFYSDLVNVPLGTAALIAVRLSGTAALAGNYAPKTTTGVTQGVTAGTLQIVLHASDIQSTEDGGGLLCMQSHRDMTAVGTSAYGLLWRPTRTTTVGFALIKITNGLLDAGNITVLSSLIAPAITRTAQLRWTVADDDSSVLLETFYGSQVNFSDLLLRFSYIDSTSPLITSVTEGGFALATSGQSYRLTFDHMTLKGPML